MGTNSQEKGIHFSSSRELNIKWVARDRSSSVAMNLTCFHVNMMTILLMITKGVNHEKNGDNDDNIVSMHNQMVQ